MDIHPPYGHSRANLPIVPRDEQPVHERTYSRLPPLVQAPSAAWSDVPLTYPGFGSRAQHEGRQEEMDQRDQWGRPYWPSEPMRPQISSRSRLSDVSSTRVPPVSDLLHDTALEGQERLVGAAHYGQTIAPASLIYQRRSTDSSRPGLPARTSSQHALVQPTTTQLSRMSEKEKMLIGRPYQHWLDRTLRQDRETCHAAVERFNNAARPSQGTSDAERSRLFHDIIEKNRSTHQGQTEHPVGRVGEQVIVDAPFTCDYGYNIHIGDNVVISSGCVMQDPCTISIGDNTILGPNVHFYGATAPLDPSQRRGARASLVGGPITVEQDCFVGADVIVLPHRTIGRGAVVGAGTVVSRDVQPATVVAGNPMRVLRSCLLYTSPSPRDRTRSRMPSSA